MKVEVHADISCPWCYVGERRLARALAAWGGDAEVSFRPFQLDPGAPEAPEPVRDQLARKFGARADAMTRRVTGVAAEEGITMDWDRALAVNTRTAHRLLRLARLEAGAAAQGALIERLFDAHFTRGGDVADHGQLTALAVEVGMDGDRVREYLASGEGGAEVDAEIAAALARGVTAVPTFVFEGKYGVSGAQPVETFLEVLAEVERREAGAAAPAGGGGGGEEGPEVGQG